MAWGRPRRARDERPVERPRVAVVGPCASGKSTLVDGLRAAGVDAYACAQEHSGVPDLWRHGAADLVIALEVDLATIRARRGREWPAHLYATQIERLAPAYAAAEIKIDTAAIPPGAALAHALAVVARWRDQHGGGERLSSA